MKFRFFSIIVVVFAVLQVALLSVAGTITGSDVDKFINTMEILEKAGHSEQLSDMDFSEEGLSGMIDSDGKFIVFERMEKKLQSYPAEYAKLRKSTKQGGFASPGEWAKVGDSVMLVYVRSEMDPSDISGMDAIPTEMIAMMPPAVQAQMANAMKMMKAVESVSDADLKTLKP